MRTVLIVVAVMCMVFSTARAQGSKKQALPPPPLPNGRTGPLPQMPLDLMSPVSPEVNYNNGELTIVAPNSILSEILRCVCEKTGAQIEIPASNERVVTRLGPGPVRDILAELLNGSRFNYVLVGSSGDPSSLKQVVLSIRTAPALATSTQLSAIRKVPSFQASTGANSATNPSAKQPELVNEDEQAPNASEVTPPAEGAVEITD